MSRRSPGPVAALLAAVLIAGGPGGPWAQGGQDVDALLASAERALAAGRVDEAERLFREAIVREPGLADAYGGLARALARAGRSGEALGVLLQVGQGLVQSGNLDAGVAYLERAVALDDGSAAAHAALGHALLRGNRFVGAVRHLRRAFALGERSTAVRIYLGSALWESAELLEAERVYRETLDAGGREASLALAPLGALLVFQGRYAEAVPLLRRAAADDADAVNLHYDLARALEGSGETAAAVQAYRRVAELAPGFSQARYRLAVLLDRGGDREAAARELQAFQALHAEEQTRTHRENLARAKLDHGWRLLEQGEPGRAAEHFRSLPQSVECLAGLAHALSRTGDHAGAVRVLERALLREPQRGDLRSLLDEQRLLARGAR